MSFLTTLHLGEHEEMDSSAEVPSDPGVKERNKILRVTMTLVTLVAGIVPFVSYLTLVFPILGSHEATLADSFSAAAKAAGVDRTPVVQADFLNVRKGPGAEHPVMGQVMKGAKVTAVAEHEGWLKILTSQGEGWIDRRYVSSPLESMSIGDLRALLKSEGLDPKVAEGFQRLPPYSPWLPAIALLLVGCSLAVLLFARTRREVVALRCLVLVWTALSLYALVFHLLCAQTFRNALAEMSSATATGLAKEGLIGSLAGVAALAFASNIKVHVGPALYILTASGALASSLSLFLVPIERRRVIRPYRNPAEPRKYLDV